MRFACRLLACALAFASLSRAASAQTVSGTVMLPDGRTPAAGVMVEATMLGAPVARARALTGRSGDFTLRLPRAGRFLLRGLRIGYRPTAFGSFEVAAGGTVEGRHVLEGAALTLPRVLVDGNRTCNITDENGALVGALLGQARLALAATLLESPDGRVTSVARRYRNIESLDGQLLAVMMDTLLTGATDRPFASIDPRVLMREGFVRDDGNWLEFRAPDAATLVSEEFVAEYCFALAPRNLRFPDWVGIAVTPARRRLGMVPIAGTLWLDKQSKELRRFDFHYLELRPELTTAGGGGSVDFHRLPTGVWMMQRWSLRLPRATSLSEDMGARSPGSFVSRVSVGTIARTGGEVVSVRLGGRTLYESETPVVVEPTGVRPAVGKGPSCNHEPPPSSRFETGTIFGIVTDSMGTLTQLATVYLDWFAGAQSRPNPAASLRRYRSAASLDGFFMFCNVGVGREVRVRADDGDLESGVMNVRMTVAEPASSMTIRLRTPMKTTDSLRTVPR